MFILEYGVRLRKVSSH